MTEDPNQKREFEIEMEKLERSLKVAPSISVDGPASKQRHFIELEALRARLVAKANANVEAHLVALIDALEATWQRAALEYDWGTYSDKNADMANLARVQARLEAAAHVLEAACRERLAYYRA